MLKGHEDLRQDERVMQLFGLINTLLARDQKTVNRDLSIRRYPIIPLAPQSGKVKNKKTTKKENKNKQHKNNIKT